MSSIFSTYSTGENRVTASILAVLRSLTLSRIERLLGAMLEQSELELVRFQNQPSRGAAGVPDALIQSSFRLLIETKTSRGTINRPQIERHLARLDEATEQTQVLLVLTPDGDRPAVLDKLDDKRLAWASFATLDQAIDELLSVYRRHNTPNVAIKHCALLKHSDYVDAGAESGVSKSDAKSDAVPLRKEENEGERNQKTLGNQASATEKYPQQESNL
jgi:uncharacterized membrane-anchored protein YjiN (DUF445 family)